MHIAAANGYDEVVDYLLDHGAKIDVVDNDAWQPIHAAACWGHVGYSVISSLLSVNIIDKYISFLLNSFFFSG